jgi:cephalosporin hydroxylase
LSIIIDEEETGEVILRNDGKEMRLPMQSTAAFSGASRARLRVGCDTKYIYSFTWLERPVIQLPEDLVRVQEVIFRVQPDVLIETGIAHCGSFIFHASLFRIMGKGRVIRVDLEIQPQNRKAIESHELFPVPDDQDRQLSKMNSQAAICRDRGRSMLAPTRKSDRP